MFQLVCVDNIFLDGWKKIDKKKEKTFLDGWLVGCFC